MQKYNAIILGSNTYFHRKIIELEPLIEHKGARALWFTLLDVENYWLE